jgi:hypothetical protein
VCRRFWLLALSLTLGCAANSYETRPFFQQEYEADTHGLKTGLDHLVELDPGGFRVFVASDYLQHAPARIAVLPFADTGSANFTIDKIPVTFRNREQRIRWAWTDAQRLRRAIQGYLSQREFTPINLGGIDAVLRVRGIDTPARLSQVPPQVLGNWLGVDAVVYGAIRNYEAYYLGLLAAWRVSVEVTIVSTHNGDVLIAADGTRFDTSLMVALSAEDIAISAAENLLQLRDINLARSEEEACREIVRRIPVSNYLEHLNQQSALDYAEDSPLQTWGGEPSANDRQRQASGSNSIFSPLRLTRHTNH